MLKPLLACFRNDLALDLGTVNTRIGVPGEGVVLDEPSLVAVAPRSRRVLSGGAAVGHLARQMQGRTPDSIVIKAPMADGVVADFALCEAMLRQFFDKVRPSGWRIAPRVLAAVPASITPVERQALLGSARRAGARAVHLIRAAKAAALGAGLPLAEPLASMVCDIGGGTTEIAVLSLGDVVAGTSIRVAGESMDRALAAYLRRRYSLRVAIAAAERLRIDIGSAYPLDEERVAEVRGLDTASGLPRKAMITSEEVRESLAEPLLAIVEAVKSTLDGCTPDLASDLVDRGMLLCGGGAMLGGIDRYLNEQTGLPVRLAPDPRSTIAQGTLICLEHLETWHAMLESSDDDV